MNALNTAFAWIEARLAAGWFQYGYVGVATCFTWEIARWTEGYAMSALVAKADPLGTAAVIAAVAAVAGAVQVFAFKHHVQGDDK